MIKFQPTIMQAEIDLLVAHLSALYERDRQLRAEGAGAETVTIKATPFTFSAELPTRLESVQDAGSGVRYAAWCIGQTAAVLLGVEALHVMFEMFSDQHGPRGGSWLDSRWNGVSDGQATWIA